MVPIEANIQTFYQWFESDTNQNENNFNSVIKSENLPNENFSNPNHSIQINNENSSKSNPTN